MGITQQIRGLEIGQEIAFVNQKRSVITSIMTRLKNEENINLKSWKMDNKIFVKRMNPNIDG